MLLQSNGHAVQDGQVQSKLDVAEANLYKRILYFQGNILYIMLLVEINTDRTEKQAECSAIGQTMFKIELHETLIWGL